MDGVFSGECDLEIMWTGKGLWPPITGHTNARIPASI